MPRTFASLRCSFVSAQLRLKCVLKLHPRRNVAAMPLGRKGRGSGGEHCASSMMPPPNAISKRCVSSHSENGLDLWASHKFLLDTL
mmetsp:Transcript_21798/g.48505  ORF Transcript_21798/g.48505 Transcript_21798/m.48505 type:complete len:86 (+) Transcript_21798:1211-1468(+)